MTKDNIRLIDQSEFIKKLEEELRERKKRQALWNENRVSDIDTRIKNVEARIEVQDRTIEEAESRREKYSSQLADLYDERAALLGEDVAAEPVVED